MIKSDFKEWTILIYADGNNEFEPEMYQNLLDCEKAGSNEYVDIVMQLGRENRKLAKLMRPSDKIPDDCNPWTGVRRYYVLKNSHELIEDIGKINMADPKSLYRFIKWGVKNYPSKHYMLVLGGHGSSFVGMITDLSQELPYIMGTPEAVNAINKASKETGKYIDILILDMCYMNTVEVIYEFGKEKINGVKNLITYIDEGPFKGLPHDKLITLVQEYGCIEDLRLFIRVLVNTMDSDLVAFEIDNSKLTCIKNLFNDIAYAYIKNKTYLSISIKEIISSSKSDNPLNKYVIDINKKLSTIVICYKRVYNIQKKVIDIVTTDLKELILIYSKTAFSRNNYWTNLLCNNYTKKYMGLNIKVDLKPTMLKPSVLASLIIELNPSISRKEAELIANKIRK